MNTDKIQNQLSRYNITQNTFFEVCPIPLRDLLGQTKSHRVTRWRTVGMVWMRLSGMTLKQAGAMFNRHHTSVVYSEIEVLNALDGFHPKLKETFDKVVNFGKDTCTMSEDLYINYVNSQLTMQNYAKRI